MQYRYLENSCLKNPNIHFTKLPRDNKLKVHSAFFGITSISTKKVKSLFSHIHYEKRLRQQAASRTRLPLSTIHCDYSYRSINCPSCCYLDLLYWGTTKGSSSSSSSTIPAKNKGPSSHLKSIQELNWNDD